LSLVGRESSDGVRSTACVVLGDTARGLVRASGDGLVLQASVLAEGVLTKAASVVSGTLGLVGREAVSTTGGSACVVFIVASALASGVVGGALGLVGGKTIGTASGATDIVLGNAASSSGLGNGGGSGSGGTAGKSGGLAGTPLTDASGVFAEAGGHVAGAHNLRSTNGEAVVVVDLTLVLRSSDGLC
jgi:hypothetical protein